MKVTVKWLKSPRHKYKIPRAPGTFSSLDYKLAKQIEKESPDMIQIQFIPKKAKAPLVKKAQTRPVEKED
jgi:hypothetical protein